MVRLSFEEIKGSVAESLRKNQAILLKGCTACEKDLQEYDEEIILSSAIPEEYFPDALEILESVSECLGEGMTLAYAYDSDVLYVRIFDGDRYVFPMPFALVDDVDIEMALINLSVYARRQLVPLIISDIPREYLEILTAVFPHIDATCYEDDDDTFFVRVNNECDLLESIPEAVSGDVRLDLISSDDAEDYAALCSDLELNKHWGYDASADNPDADANYYLSVVERELNDGVALTLAIRYRGRFAGEAVIYDFDYFGSASVAVRVLPEFHGMGVGTSALSALIELSSRIGLCSLRTEIMNENLASIKMTSKCMKLEKVGKYKTNFTLTLN